MEGQRGEPERWCVDAAGVGGRRRATARLRGVLRSSASSTAGRVQSARRGGGAAAAVVVVVVMAVGERKRHLMRVLQMLLAAWCLAHALALRHQPAGMDGAVIGSGRGGS